jgi:subtilase family serine protease
MKWLWLRLRSRRKQAKPSESKSNRRFAPQFESLESRYALSGMAAVHTDLMFRPFAGSSSSPQGFSPAQVQAAYGFNNVQFGSVKGDGSNETIAIVDAYNDPNILSDLARFDSQFSLPAPPSIKVVNQNGGTSLPSANRGWATEIALDVEWAHAIAPGANILLVEASSATSTSLDAALDYARNAPGVVVVSNSWGGSEYSTEKSEDVHFTTPAGHAGVTFTVAAGDSGTGAEYPSSSPNVLSVGGTSLRLGSGSAWSSESVWSGGGGGTSLYESVPGYQSGLGLTKRGTPDVSYDADPNTGVAVYDTYGSSGWVEVGGTSAGAPQWAALIAIADQGRAIAGLGSLGNAQAALYSLPRSDFHDIVAGSNGLSATAGYDVSSGIGSPIANLVIADLVTSGGSTGSGGTSGSSGGTSGTSGTSGSSTLGTPTITNAAAVSSTSASLTWTSVTGASGYSVLIVDPTTGLTTSIGSVGPTTTSATVTGLTAGSSVTFEIEAFTSTQVADSTPVLVSLPAPPPQATLTAPQVTATAVSSTSVALSWGAVTGAQGYRIYYWNGYRAVLIGTVSASTTSVTVVGLYPGSTNQLLVQAYSGSSVANSDWITITTPYRTTRY